jgi:hypothetical protein
LTINYSLIAAHGLFKVPELIAEEVNFFLSGVQMTAQLHIQVLTMDRHGLWDVVLHSRNFEGVLLPLRE